MEIDRDVILVSENMAEYRQFLGRHWDHNLPYMGLVMLNPSVANGDKDDPTIRRCIDFAQRLGFGGIEVYNIYDFIATDQDDLMRAKRKVSTSGNVMIGSMGFSEKWFDTVVFACGKPKKGDHKARITEVYDIVKEQGFKVKCLGITKEGYPRHPLYLKKETQLKVWKPIWI